MPFFDRLTVAQRSAISSFSGFFFYGGWAFLVNIMHGTSVALKAGFVQGSYSFLITLGMTLALEALYRFFTRILNNKWFSASLTVCLCCSVVFTGSWMVNVAAGTPEIFETVILGYLIGGAYSISYVFGLNKVVSNRS